MLNDCTETGNGDNNAVCHNIGSDIITEITQSNFVDATNTIGAGFVESNTINTLQGFDETNDCDEAGDGANSANCVNDVENLVGPIDQSNDVTGSTPNTIHSNNIEVSQLADARNDCDESGAGVGINDALCANDTDNTIDSIEQQNQANGQDNAAQTNDFSVIQSSDLNNNCDEFENGDNTVFCLIESQDNEVGDVEQFNSASGSAGATISQNSEIDGDDALGIAGITQILVADNTCGQTGSGNNDASCVFEGIDNFIDPIFQGNLVSNADDGTVISQDNRAVISQVNAGENDCDENTFTDTHDNNADCLIGGLLNNFLGPIDQVNEIVDAQDNSISNQDNNVAVSQDLLTENDCNGTGGNDVQCTNDGFEDGIDIFDFNFIAEIDQFNDAILTGDVSSAQVNDVALAQTGALVNTCDETGGGVNQAVCENVDLLSFVGPISQSNVVNAPDSDTAVQSNGAQIAQNLDAVNDCDEEGTGFNLATCSAAGIAGNAGGNEIDSITQTNTGTEGDDTAQSNFVGASQDAQTDNVCDETGLGDNAAQCGVAAINSIGPVRQTNDAVGSGDADFTQNNNIPTINQVAATQNDCDQSDEQTASGNNEATCAAAAVNSIDSITQINDAEGTHVDDIFQDNSGAFSQVATVNNGCDATTFTFSGDNEADCAASASNFIGPVVQDNDATGRDDVLIDQDNNVAVSQDVSVNDDCDATAFNIASCAVARS